MRGLSKSHGQDLDMTPSREKSQRNSAENGALWFDFVPNNDATAVFGLNENIICEEASVMHEETQHSIAKTQCDPIALAHGHRRASAKPSSLLQSWSLVGFLAARAYIGIRQR